ncbi:flagellar export chaperone FliS [Ferrimonas aestuarii]|uniref:Flagellar secretion chaperone FliS n=1 Tax=Ferrimonas aestuarii TaxID=2569539 RepID=A0A4V5NWI1_9GAMM|nr:flagellar export chaperone FliS [Ferrimonas aestuarii]TKB58228.1 flagellar export chaperone FliS [Ferrimonas aestuarii]
MRGSLKAYSKMSVDSQKAEASPHKVVQLLLGGSIDKLIQAKLCIETKQISKKGELTGRTVEILTHLKAALDFEKGGEIADNLSALYEYAIRRITEANAENSGEKLDEVIDLLKTVKEGWDAIPAEHHQLKTPA